MTGFALLCNSSADAESGLFACGIGMAFALLLKGDGVGVRLCDGGGTFDAEPPMLGAGRNSGDDVFNSNFFALAAALALSLASNSFCLCSERLISSASRIVSSAYDFMALFSESLLCDNSSPFRAGNATVLLLVVRNCASSSSSSSLALGSCIKFIYELLELQ